MTQKPFEGCIKDVMLGSTNRDLNDNVEVKGVLPGCPEVSNNRATTHNIMQKGVEFHLMIIKYYRANYIHILILEEELCAWHCLHMACLVGIINSCHNLLAYKCAKLPQLVIDSTTSNAKVP